MKWINVINKMPPVNDTVCRRIGYIEILDSIDFHIKVERKQINPFEWEWLDESNQLSLKEYTEQQMTDCFTAGVKFGRDMMNNPSNSEYIQSLKN